MEPVVVEFVADLYAGPRCDLLGRDAVLDRVTVESEDGLETELRLAPRRLAERIRRMAGRFWGTSPRNGDLRLAFSVRIGPQLYSPRVWSAAKPISGMDRDPTTVERHLAELRDSLATRVRDALRERPAASPAT